MASTLYDALKDAGLEVEEKDPFDIGSKIKVLVPPSPKKDGKFKKGGNNGSGSAGHHKADPSQPHPKSVG